MSAEANQANRYALSETYGQPTYRLQAVTLQLLITVCQCSLGKIVTRGSLTVDLSKDSGSDKHTFCIEADQVQQLLRSSGRSEDELLCDLIQQASSLARPPISSFLVGYVQD